MVITMPVPSKLGIAHYAQVRPHLELLYIICILVCMHLAVCVSIHCTAAMFHHTAYTHTHTHQHTVVLQYTLIMAARPGTNQRTNGIPREKICQFKLVLLGEPYAIIILLCIAYMDMEHWLKLKHSIDITPVVRNSNLLVSFISPLYCPWISYSLVCVVN